MYEVGWLNVLYCNCANIAHTEIDNNQIALQNRKRAVLNACTHGIMVEVVDGGSSGGDGGGDGLCFSWQMPCK